MAKIPTFAKASSLNKIQAAIDKGLLTYPAYVYVADTKNLMFIDSDLSINKVVDDETKEIAESVTTIQNNITNIDERITAIEEKQPDEVIKWIEIGYDEE